MQPFQAESKRLLDLMINSIYTHKEIFLRELISNASDAIDKLYYRALDDGTTGIAKEEFKITLAADKDARILTISDNGCGMTRAELEQNLGTIADSGTLRFRAEHADEDIESIGQFGVGFYSAFMVAKKLTVVSRAFGMDEAWRWESEGAEGFTVSPAQKDGHGTDVIIHIKDDVEGESYSEFLDTYRLQSLVKRYSDYIRYPIRMEVEKSRLKETEEKEGEEKRAPEYETYTETETVNSMVPIWKRSKSELTQELYDQFYKEKFGSYEAPLHTTHISAEGVVSYHALLYFPASAPYNYYSRDFEKGLQLYSNGVLIMEKCADVLPDYFSFVQGVVDSPDFSLNISRELLQHDRQLKVISSNIEKKIKSELVDLQVNEREKYEQLWKAFGVQIKFGVYHNFGAKKDFLADLLLFHSMRGNKLITLKEYLDAMPETQKEIYYASGATVEQAERLPQLDIMRERGFDVLLLTDDVDEFTMQMMMEYGDKPIKSASAKDLDVVDEEEKKAAAEEAEESKPLLESLTSALMGHVKAVRLTTRLKSHPACLTTDGPITLEMERVLNSMPSAGDAVKAERVLELNPNHPVFKKLQTIEDDEKRAQYAQILYAQAQILEGMLPDNADAYADAVMALME